MKRRVAPYLLCASFLLSCAGQPRVIEAPNAEAPAAEAKAPQSANAPTRPEAAPVAAPSFGASAAALAPESPAPRIQAPAAATILGAAMAPAAALAPERLLSAAPRPVPSESARELPEPALARDFHPLPEGAALEPPPAAGSLSVGEMSVPTSVHVILVPAKSGLETVSEGRTTAELVLPATVVPAERGGGASSPVAQPGATQASQQPAARQGPAPAASPKTGAGSGASSPVSSPSLPAAPPSAAPLVMPGIERKPVTRAAMSADAGSKIEIPFEGTGWTYLGEKNQKEGVRYDSRRFEGSNLVFVLSVSKSGDYLLWFQKQDPLLGSADEVLVPLAVSQKPEAQPASEAPAQVGSSRPAAPVGAAPQAAAAQGAQVLGASAGSAAGSAPAARPTPESPQETLLAARKDIEAGRAQAALDGLMALLALHPTGLDEAFFLLAQALELNGPTRDVKRAYSYYKKLREEYPHSQFWDRAGERMTYIERHFFEIR